MQRLQEFRRRRPALLGELGREIELHGKGDQALPSTVVDVALDTHPLGIGRKIADIKRRTTCCSRKVAARICGPITFTIMIGNASGIIATTGIVRP
ncbi:MAG: hypothetical protein ACI9C1_001766 [Candidatus Aldehydirespiratoraceae bacterium]|jgi:hypothetical protein